jgi:hypothetical protein
MRGKISPFPNSPQVDAERIEVKNAEESWNVYWLDDGSKIRLKPVVTEVWRVEGAFDNDGNPLYVTKTALVQAVDAPTELKRKLQ